ncbi:O-antigen ligase family protein [Vibrio nigripulchritudo]|uniref:O-antigen ligase family protein n=1 Tax=Vibrio nigripulchritudo TaxID=28173 RepID=UPI0005FA7939|nr:O-antigen ligase family protein [Vibrio nigripulchritudo]KJY79081.1 hypothetical protein TW74_10355 [Vibrio nigripulchritudo]
MSKDKFAKILDSEKFILLMVFSACVYAAFKDSWRLFADIFQTSLLLVSLLAIIVKWDFFKKERILWLLPIAIIVQLFSWWHSLLFYQEFASPTPQLGRLVELFMFFFFSFWLRGNKKYITFFLICFMIGSVFTLNYHSPLIPEIWIGLSGIRVDFDYRNAQHGSLIIGASVLITAFFFMTEISKRKVRKINILLLFFHLLFLILILFLLQTRQSFIGIILAMTITILAWSINRKESKKTLISISVITLIIITLSFINNNVIFERINSELYILTDYLLKGNFSNIPHTSFGVRLQLWYESFSWFNKSPFIGYGNKVEVHMIEKSHYLPNYITSEFKHVHSSYIATLLRFGIFGLILALTILVIPVVEAFNLCSKHQHTKNIQYLALMFLVFWLVVNTFESFWYMKAGLWTYTVFMAAIYTIPLSNRYKNYQASLKS